MSNPDLTSSQRPISSSMNARFYEVLVNTVIKEDGIQRSISKNTKGIYHVHEIAFVYQFEKKMHDMFPKFDIDYVSSFREYSTENTRQSDLVLQGVDQNIIFEFKMDCALSSVAHDAVKLGPSVKSGDAAYLINIKTMSVKSLFGFPKQRTNELSQEIKNITNEPYYVDNVVSEFDFISQAGNSTLADVICMWEVHI
ncbi:hypothetical protein [Rhodovibrio sodomensis]|uniref:hypothetical protein n=1 Tax=Rhodovibrio sodomensis TaxID=1088 RepID=UPI0019074925|nr:hypothetical protein [Rhodovibrio sodomensis]